MQLLGTIFSTLLTSTHACYHWTEEDLAAIKAGGSGPNAERPVCESHGHVFTQGDESKAPGCGKCRCCHITAWSWESSNNEFSDCECPYLKHGVKGSLEHCKGSCLEEPACTAFNHQTTSGDCVLRSCDIPIEVPIKKRSTHRSYWMPPSAGSKALKCNVSHWTNWSPCCKGETARKKVVLTSLEGKPGLAPICKTKKEVFNCDQDQCADTAWSPGVRSTVGQSGIQGGDKAGAESEGLLIAGVVSLGLLVLGLIVGLVICRKRREFKRTPKVDINDVYGTYDTSGETTDYSSVEDSNYYYGN